MVLFFTIKQDSGMVINQGSSMVTLVQLDSSTIQKQVGWNIYFALSVPVWNFPKLILQSTKQHLCLELYLINELDVYKDRIIYYPNIGVFIFAQVSSKCMFYHYLSVFLFLYNLLWYTDWTNFLNLSCLKEGEYRTGPVSGGRDRGSCPCRVFSFQPYIFVDV